RRARAAHVPEGEIRRTRTIFSIPCPASTYDHSSACACTPLCAQTRRPAPLWSPAFFTSHCSPFTSPPPHLPPPHLPTSSHPTSHIRHPMLTSSPTPDLAAAVLHDLADPSVCLEDIAAHADITLDALAAWMSGPDGQARLAALASAASARARL